MIILTMNTGFCEKSSLLFVYLFHPIITMIIRDIWMESFCLKYLFRVFGQTAHCFHFSRAALG